MTIQDEQAIAEFPEVVRRWGEKLFEFYKDHMGKQIAEWSNIEKHRLFDFVDSELDRSYRRYFNDDNPRLDFKPLFSESTLYFNDQEFYISKIIPRDTPKLDRIRSNFVLLCYAIDWIKEQFELLLGEGKQKQTARKKNGSLSQMQQALFTVYRQEAGLLSAFENHPKKKEKAIEEYCLTLNCSWKNFRIQYNKVIKPDLRMNLPNFLKDTEAILPALQAFPKALEIAMGERKKAELKIT